jgi:hypothetical protein
MEAVLCRLASRFLGFVDPPGTLISSGPGNDAHCKHRSTECLKFGNLEFFSLGRQFLDL